MSVDYENAIKQVEREGYKNFLMKCMDNPICNDDYFWFLLYNKTFRTNLVYNVASSLEDSWKNRFITQEDLRENVEYFKSMFLDGDQRYKLYDAHTVNGFNLITNFRSMVKYLVYVDDLKDFNKDLEDQTQKYYVWQSNNGKFLGVQTLSMSIEEYLGYTGPYGLGLVQQYDSFNDAKNAALVDLSTREDVVLQLKYIEFMIDFQRYSGKIYNFNSLIATGDFHQVNSNQILSSIKKLVHQDYNPEDFNIDLEENWHLAQNYLVFETIDNRYMVIQCIEFHVEEDIDELACFYKLFNTLGEAMEFKGKYDLKQYFQ